MRRSSCRSSQSGFSLLEILMAFAILSLSLGVLLRIFGGGGQIASTADEYSRAIIVAESLMATLGIESPLKPGETSGQIGDSYRWILRVELYPVDEADMSSANFGYKPYWVNLTVEWGEIDDARAFDLKTLRLIRNDNFGGLQ